MPRTPSGSFGLVVTLVGMLLGDPAVLHGKGKSYRDGEILVRLKDQPAARGMWRAASVRGRIARRFTSVRGLHLVTLPAGTSVPEAVAAAQRDPDVLYAEPNYVVEAFAVPDDPRFGELWGLENAGSARRRVWAS